MNIRRAPSKKVYISEISKQLRIQVVGKTKMNEEPVLCDDTGEIKLVTKEKIPENQWIRIYGKPSDGKLLVETFQVVNDLDIEKYKKIKEMEENDEV